MQIPCVSCQSLFLLDSNLVSPAGSLVRCSKCKYIFMVYPPSTNNEPIVRDSTIDQSILFDLFRVDQTLRAKMVHHQDPAVINILETGEITSIDDFEQEEGDQ